VLLKIVDSHLERLGVTLGLDLISMVDPETLVELSDNPVVGQNLLVPFFNPIALKSNILFVSFAPPSISTSYQIKIIASPAFLSLRPRLFASDSKKLLGLVIIHQ
jgi:hypothetical protein